MNYNHPKRQINPARTLAAALLALGCIGTVPLAAAGEADPNALEKAGQFVSDATLTTKIKAEFVESEALSAADIKVESTDGVVTLSGDVMSKDQAKLAEQVAEGVEGVRDVHNELRVASSQ